MALQAKKERVRGRPFPPGVSGNPRGRPKSALGKRTLLMRRLEANDLIQLLEAQEEVGEAILRFFAARELSIKDLQTAVRIYVSINDYLCTLLEAARRIDRRKETLAE